MSDEFGAVVQSLTRAARFIHRAKEAAHGVTGPKDVRLARWLRRISRRQQRLESVERSDDSTGWVVETVSKAGGHLMGATTYAALASFWPGASGPFAKPMNEIPRVVFSNSLTSADWDETEIAGGDLAEAITRLTQERSDGYLLAHGGARFARSLVETGLIDEYRLVIHPIVLGESECSRTRERAKRGLRAPSPSASFG